mmetsp:Transcript_6010/g.12218  ORF Transcript_6010/g.12218 Transcript_6010/m.12218 type:complete len:638 (+) Transcript_6010:132-2045(+)
MTGSVASPDSSESSSRRPGRRLGHPSSQILKQWLFTHRENPYPTPEQKEELQRMTGLTRMQLDAWLTNGRQRYVAPKERRGANPNYARYSKDVREILVDWLVDHIKHPYPKNEEMAELMEKTKLTKRQIQNWMTNSRKRKLIERMAADGKISEEGPVSAGPAGAQNPAAPGSASKNNVSFSSASSPSSISSNQTAMFGYKSTPLAAGKPSENGSSGNKSLKKDNCNNDKHEESGGDNKSSKILRKALSLSIRPGGTDFSKLTVDTSANVLTPTNITGPTSLAFSPSNAHEGFFSGSMMDIPSPMNNFGNLNSIRGAGGSFEMPPESPHSQHANAFLTPMLRQQFQQQQQQAFSSDNNQQQRLASQMNMNSLMSPQGFFPSPSPNALGLAGYAGFGQSLSPRGFNGAFFGAGLPASPSHASILQQASQPQQQQPQHPRMPSSEMEQQQQALMKFMRQSNMLPPSTPMVFSPTNATAIPSLSPGGKWKPNQLQQLQQLQAVQQQQSEMQLQQQLQQHHQQQQQQQQQQAAFWQNMPQFTKPQEPEEFAQDKQEVNSPKRVLDSAGLSPENTAENVPLKKRKRATKPKLKQLASPEETPILASNDGVENFKVSKKSRACIRKQEEICNILPEGSKRGRQG